LKLSFEKPLPRYRLYTNLEKYCQVFKDILFFKSVNGDEVKNFEHEIKSISGMEFAIALPQNRVGTYLALKALIPQNSKVIMSPYTIHDVVNMVICAGGEPVFVDVERKTSNLDVKLIESYIDKNTGAILITHMLGLTMNIKSLADICKQKNIVLIEDVAQAFGACLDGKMAGTFGDAGIYSFGMYKNLNTFLGGMLVTSRSDLFLSISKEIYSYPYQRIDHLIKIIFKSLLTDIATYPPIFKLGVYDLFRYGFLNNIEAINKKVSVEVEPQCKLSIPSNYLSRMRPLQARAGLLSLKHFKSDNFTRISFAKKYHEGLKGIDELIIPPLKEDGSHIYYYYPIQYKKRHELVRFMMQSGCDVAVQHIKNCAELDCFKDYYSHCPNASATANETILLPTYPRYSFKDVERNIRTIQIYFNH